MSKKDEALKLALECLDGVWRGKYNGNAEDAITAIREALAEQPAQQQEPQPPYEFERYVAGSLRAQGVRVERATTLADAMRIAAKICPPANPPSAPTVLVYTNPQPAQRTPFLEPDYYVYNIDGQYRLADPQPTIKWGKK